MDAATPGCFDDADARERLLLEAQSWVGTPFAARQRVKGAGVDCVHLCAELMVACGALDGYTFPRYTLDWSTHRAESLLLGWLDGSPRFARLPAGESPAAGDIVCFNVGRCVHHCAVMLDGRRMVQALDRAVVTITQLDDPTWADRLDGGYRPRPR